MITVVIPTHNRHQYISRAAKYYIGMGLQVLVLDSSLECFSVNENIDNLSYYHLPGLTFAEKIKFGCELVETEYIALSPDDDFIFEDSIFNAICVLENNKNISLYYGEFQFYKNSFKISNDTKTLLNYNNFAVYEKEKQIKCLMNNYTQCLWSVYKKDVLENSMDIVILSDFDNDNFIEMTVMTCAISAGEIFFCKNFFGIREDSQIEHWGSRHKRISIKNLDDIKKFNFYCEEKLNNKYSVFVLDGYFEFIKRRKKMIYRLRLKIQNFYKKKKTNLVSITRVQKILNEGDLRE